MDIVGPLAGESNPTFILVLVDLFSRWPELKIITDTSSGAVIKFLDEIFSREGLPDTILTDNGTQFCSKEMKEFLDSNAIKHKL